MVGRPVGSKPRVGVLALQGDFEAHSKALAAAGAEPVEVRTAADMESVAGLVIPGGESTTMLKLMGLMELQGALAEFGKTKPILGTCAGAILLARDVTNPVQESFGMLDLTVQRNAYGRQVDSCVASLAPESDFAERVGEGSLEAVFIRAPKILRAGPGVKILAEYQGDPVLVEQGLHMAATFHPELTADSRVHRLFLSKIR